MSRRRPWCLVEGKIYSVVLVSAAGTGASGTAASAAGGGTPMVCNLADLASVRKFAAELPSDVDVLCLNAGVSPSRKEEAPTRTVDGFQETWGVNHLAHFLLASLAQPQLAANKARLVITASGVHVRFLRVYDKSGYQTARWVRYLTKAGGSSALSPPRPLPLRRTFGRQSARHRLGSFGRRRYQPLRRSSHRRCYWILHACRR